MRKTRQSTLPAKLTGVALCLILGHAGMAQSPTAGQPFTAGDNSFSAAFPGPVTATPLRNEVSYTCQSGGAAYRVLVRNRDFQGQPGESDSDILADYVASFIGHVMANYQKNGITAVFEPTGSLNTDNATGLGYTVDLGSQSAAYRFWLTANLLYVASVTYPKTLDPAPDTRGFLTSIVLPPAAPRPQP